MVCGRSAIEGNSCLARPLVLGLAVALQGVVADTYHVPLWSLAEINAVSPRTPLTEGQRIVIPRHLVPMAVASMATPSPATNAVSSFAPVGR